VSKRAFKKNTKSTGSKALSACLEIFSIAKTETFSMKQKRNLTVNDVSLAGEYAVLSQLKIRGFVAALTHAQTKAIDILVKDPDTGKQTSVEVKTRLKEDNQPSRDQTLGEIMGEWLLKEDDETIHDDLIYVFVNAAEREPEFYVIPSSVVAKSLVDRRKWRVANNKKQPSTKMRRFRLGKKGIRYPSILPIAEDYADRWDLLR
jgi:hypothetical protein